MNVSAKCSDFAGVFQPLQVKAQWSSVDWLLWSEVQWILFWLEEHETLITNTSRERISRPSEAWEGFPQMVPMGIASVRKSPVFLKWFFASKILGSSKVLIRPYTGASTQADKVQSLIYRIDQNSRELLKFFRSRSMTGWQRLVGQTGREAGEVNGSNQSKFTASNEEKF